MQLLQILQDIASHVRLDYSTLHLSYDDFPPVEVSTARVVQIQKMSQEIQHDYLNLKLMELIYRIYYEGSFVKQISQPIKTNEQILRQIASAEVDWEFYEQLEKNNHSKGWFHSDYLVLKQEDDNSLAVTYDGITFHIRPEIYLKLEEQSASVNDLVSVWTPAGGIERELYTAAGEGEIDNSVWKDPSNPVLLAYFNFDPEAAIILMKYLTTKLNEIKLPFVFKVLHNPLNYQRYDSGMLQFHRSNYQLLRQILQTIYSELESHFQPQVPIFTKVIAPGIGLAEHPYSQLLFAYKESFGINRCQIVANALVEAYMNGDDSPESRMKYILQHFDNLGIDIEHPYLNPNSEDIYTPLA
ncbi:MAG: T3SS effector HopA1 family protein [Nostocaceae cyanobacterium]|nr:T3SS effector HopA1 family protein [Nostocaceae cyanobacterium]